MEHQETLNLIKESAYFVKEMVLDITSMTDSDVCSQELVNRSVIAFACYPVCVDLILKGKIKSNYEVSKFLLGKYQESITKK